jgi:hypothetical protein
MAARYLLAGITAAGLAFWYDFKSWQSFGDDILLHAKSWQLTADRHWRHATNAARLSQDPTMGTLSALLATKSFGSIANS